MTPPPARKRGSVRPGAPITPLRKLGEIRRAQVVTTYGVGSMIAVDNESFVVAGLDTWDVSRTRTLWEPRLTRATGVHEFKLPPAVDSENARDGLRAARFPQLYSCPECRELQYYSKFNPPRDKAVCGACERDLVPSRFVMACVDGHLDDFPYWKWVHRSSFGHGDAGTAGRCGGKLRLRADGSTASLRGVVVGCTCGAKEVSMEGAFRSQALRDLGIRCTGRRPWLKDAPAEQCGEPPRTLQRGSSTVWYPVVHSALSIPPWSDGVLKALGPHWSNIHDETEADIRTYLRMAKFEEEHRNLTVDDAVAAIRRVREAEAAPSAEEHTTLSPRDLLYQEEYRTLQHERPEDGRDELQDFVCEPPADDRTPDGIGQVMLVKRVREIRALQSFTRVEEPAIGDTTSSSRRAALALRKPNWLPAIEVSGEGVFIRLDTEHLSAWERRSQPRERAERVRRNHEALLRDRYANSERSAPPSPVSPRYLAVHTLAHLLINEWSLDGGYPTASLRERLYVGAEMAGFLIYTATSDSAGSLGGIVAQGEPERLASSLESALLRASWCSNDPLCSEATASGTDSVNLAACHACVLLPETSCETNNAFLDRVALVGTPDGAVPGLF
ncbi:DUF1998 domain-containing protein [Yinghuangia sp. ASG 101]|uniref:DUF1998 domain-containing protein n=1 Tax=Yinghuangia sp. ASG 101 TaxID=2896848 RepID=UPI001E34E2A9|nr:DUF1998 domain-containing protein [Yinghuangia sp. ASG 101]UGQ13487.1 DUF1998 domain-containing protein [Yinghuangia sp. ASG 101]